MAKARRAKKEKFPKKLLLVPVAMIGIVGTTIGLTSNNKKIETVGVQVGTPLSGASLNNTFTENNIKYLPIVYSDPEEVLTKADIEREFKKAGITIKSISSETIGTGKRIETDYGTYTLLIYGDVNSDGYVDVLDAQAILKHILYGRDKTLTGTYRIAANVAEETEPDIDISDASRIVKFILGNIKGTTKVINSIPASDISKDNVAPVITLKGNSEVTVKVGENYKEDGATVTDNLDLKISDKLKIDTSKVNTNVPGDYEITYNVTDASGNKATTVKRIVHVVDYVKDIDIKYFDSQYTVGQTVTLSELEAYKIYAYKTTTDERISSSEIDFTPITLTEDMIGSKHIQVTYKGEYGNITKTITINVKAQSSGGGGGGSRPVNPPKPPVEKDISGLQEVALGSTVTTNYCFDTIPFIKVTSKTGEKALTENELSNIKCIVRKSGEATEVSQESGEIKISKTIDKGVVTMSFSAKQAGTYEITPYIQIEGEDKYILDADQNTVSKSVTIEENKTIDKVIISKTNNFEDEIINYTEDVRDVKLDFGKVYKNMEITKYIAFYHAYDTDEGKVLRRVDVNYEEITIPVDGIGAEINKIRLYSDDTEIQDNNYPDKFINNISMEVKDDATASSASFKIKLGNYEATVEATILSLPTP